MKGSVLWFDDKKGYGFLKSEIGNELYFHWTSIISDENFKTLCSGQPVTYELSTNFEGKTVATEVKPTERFNDKTGKYILLCAFTILKGTSDISQMQYDVMRHIKQGVKYAAPYKDIIIGTDSKLTKEELRGVAHYIKQHYDEVLEAKSKGLRNVFNDEDLAFDIIFL